MSIIVSIDVIKKTICTPAGEELVRYAEERGLTEVSFDETIAHWKKLGKRNWAVWLYKNKAMFEQLANTQATPEEEIKYANDLNYLSQEQEVYVVNNTWYKTLEEAQAARAEQIQILTPKAEELVVCSLEVIHKNADTTWELIDLDDFIAPTDRSYNIKVFNPMTGVYTTCSSLTDALTLRNELILKTIDDVFSYAVIRTVVKHPDFLDDMST